MGVLRCSPTCAVKATTTLHIFRVLPQPHRIFKHKPVAFISFYTIHFLSLLSSSTSKMWASRLRSRSQKSSRYLPVVGSSSPSSSRSSSLDSSRNPKDKKRRGSSGPLSTKRRSTMNSRDAAYDEEQLRRAIEESKEGSKSVTDDLGSRRGKRSRSDSESYVNTLGV